MNYFIKVLQNYANFNGRARRSEYWYFVLFNMLVYIALAVAGYALKFEMLPMIYNLAVLVPSLAVGVRRLHDVNKSGWYLLIPIYNLILLVTDGDRGDNQYGADPKAVLEL